MRRALAAAALVVVALFRAPDVRAADATLRIGVLLPTHTALAALAADARYGAELAVDESEGLRKAGEKRPAVELVALEAGDEATAAAALADAAKQKLAGVVALVTGATAAPVEAAARKAKLPLVLLGAVAPHRTSDPADPVFRVEPEAADAGLALADALRLRTRGGLGLPQQTKRALLVVEDVPWARQAAAALHAADAAEVAAPGELLTRSGVPLAFDPVAWAARTPDRVVVLGGPDVLRAVLDATDAAKWSVPVLATEASLDAGTAAALSGRRHVGVVVAARPAVADERRLGGLAAGRAPPAGSKAPLSPVVAKALAGTAALVDGAVAAKKSAVAEMRALTQTLGGHRVPLFDGAGTLERWTWSWWAGGAGGPDSSLQTIRPTYLPDAALGPFLGPRQGARYRAHPGGPCVTVGFGGGPGQPPRTVDADLATLGLRSGDAKVDELFQAEVVARTCGKLSRIWSRNYDGSPRDAVSWRISFVPHGTATAGATAVWDAVIASDGPDGQHGGQALPAQKRAVALSTYLLRNSAALQKERLTPPLAATDLPYLDGTYAWNASSDGNQRSDRIRALADGVASAFAMKLSKEVGHLAGLGVDHSGEARSVMVAKGGEGVPDDVAYFPPAFAKVLEKTLGRVPGADRR